MKKNLRKMQINEDNEINYGTWAPSKCKTVERSRKSLFARSYECSPVTPVTKDQRRRALKYNFS